MYRTDLFHIIGRLVKGSCVFKHTYHKVHIRHVPIVKRLVEGVCVYKHTIHRIHFGHVPII